MASGATLPTLTVRDVGFRQLTRFGGAVSGHLYLSASGGSPTHLYELTDAKLLVKSESRTTTVPLVVQRTTLLAAEERPRWDRTAVSRRAADFRQDVAVPLTVTSEDRRTLETPGATVTLVAEVAVSRPAELMELPLRRGASAVVGSQRFRIEDPGVVGKPTYVALDVLTVNRRPSAQGGPIGYGPLEYALLTPGAAPLPVANVGSHSQTAVLVLPGARAWTQRQDIGVGPGVKAPVLPASASLGVYAWQELARATVTSAPVRPALPQ